MQSQLDNSTLPADINTANNMSRWTQCQQTVVEDQQERDWLYTDD